MAKKTAKTTVLSQHRNAALAERHRKQLEKKIGGTVRIIRRNAKGQISKRGKTFQFIVEPKKKKGAPIRKRKPEPKEPKFRGELALKTSYKAKKSSKGYTRHALMTDVRLFVRRARTEREIKEALTAHVMEQEPLPSWLSIQTYNWGHETGTTKTGDADDFRALFDNGAPYNADEMEILKPE